MKAGGGGGGVDGTGGVEAKQLKLCKKKKICIDFAKKENITKLPASGQLIIGFQSSHSCVSHDLSFCIV